MKTDVFIHFFATTDFPISKVTFLLFTWQRGSAHALRCHGQEMSKVSTVISVAAVHGADEAGSGTGQVAVHDWADRVPQRAVPFAVAGGRRALTAGMTETI